MQTFTSMRDRSARAAIEKIVLSGYRAQVGHYRSVAPFPSQGKKGAEYAGRVTSRIAPELASTPCRRDHRGAHPQGLMAMHGHEMQGAEDMRLGEAILHVHP